MSAAAASEQHKKRKAKEEEEEEDEEEEEGDIKKSKKEKRDSKKSKTKTVALPKIFELNEYRKVAVSEYKGKVLVDIREYYTDKNDGASKPGKKGISLTPELWQVLQAHLPAINETLAAFGFDADAEENGS